MLSHRARARARRASLDNYLKTRAPVAFLADLRSKLLLSQREAAVAGTQPERTGDRESCFVESAL